ncbi:MAG: shikimate kinase [Deltaproteobacteria bacterium]|nr:shikimate kinase [Deltaproteobacteria bacterium]
MRRGSAETLSLCGMMGSGKSTVARILARLTGLPLVSTDARVEALAGRSIAGIFAAEGEPAFRSLERRVVGSLVAPAVVDLGGGAFCDPGSAERLLALGPVVFLDVSPEEAARRIGEGEGRPLAATWPALLSRRLPLYRRATLCLPVDGVAPEALARRILALTRWGGRPASPFEERT